MADFLQQSLPPGNGVDSDTADASSPLALPLPGINLDSIKAAAEAWQAAMLSRKRKCNMPPWMEATYFEPVRITSVTLSMNTDSVIVPSEPARVILILHTNSATSGQSYFQPNKPIDPNNITGLSLNANQQPYLIHQKDFGPLPSLEWHGLTIQPSVIVTALEVLIKDWPG